MHGLILVAAAAAAATAAVSRPVVVARRTLLVELLQQGVHLVFGRRFGEYGRVAEHATVQCTLRLRNTNKNNVTIRDWVGNAA